MRIYGRAAPTVSVVKDNFHERKQGLEKHAKLVTAPCFVHRVDAKATVFT